MSGIEAERMMDSRTISAAHAVLIERIIDQRKIKLRGKIERVGPCPRCGGTDRFSINIKNSFSTVAAAMSAVT